MAQRWGQQRRRRQRCKHLVCLDGVSRFRIRQDIAQIRYSDEINGYMRVAVREKKVGNGIWYQVSRIEVESVNGNTMESDAFTFYFISSVLILETSVELTCTHPRVGIRRLSDRVNFGCNNCKCLPRFLFIRCGSVI